MQEAKAYVGKIGKTKVETKIVKQEDDCEPDDDEDDDEDFPDDDEIKENQGGNQVPLVLPLRKIKKTIG